MKKELDLIENKELREEYINRVEILEKVKQLLLIDGADVATTKQVADFYEVDEDTVRQIVTRNHEELLEDGIINYTGKEIKAEFLRDNMSFKTFSGGFTINDVKFANKGNNIFPRRAILRVGMLLRDSIVAKEVRTQLLNIEEKVSDEVKVQDISEEQKLLLEYGTAYMSGDLNALSVAGANLMAFKNRHIEKLETDKKALAESILEWEDRAKITSAMNKLASRAHKLHSELYHELYEQLRNKYHIDPRIRDRKDGTIIGTIKEHEWDMVVKSLSALCERYGVSPSDLFTETNEKTVRQRGLFGKK